MTDGCVLLLYNSSWKFLQLAAGQLLSEQPVRYGKGRWYKITYKITPAGSLSFSQPGGPSCWASPLALGLIGYYNYTYGTYNWFPSDFVEGETELETLHTVIFMKILTEALGCQNIIDSFIMVDAGEKYLKMNGY
jgi:hypothetical protein